MFASKRRISILIISVLIALCSIAAFLLGDSAAFARAEASSHDFYVDYETTGLVEGQYYSKDHVAVKEGGSRHGMIPAAEWDDYGVDMGAGYIVYKIESTGGALLDDVVLSFNAYVGYMGISAYGDYTHFRILTSTDNATYREVVDLANVSASQKQFMTSTVTNANNQTGIVDGQTGVFGMQSVYADYTVDLSAAAKVGKTSVLYVKLAFEHISYDTMTNDDPPVPVLQNYYAGFETELGGNTDRLDLLPTGRSGIKLLNFGYDYKEVADNGTTLSESISFDFDEEQYVSGYDWDAVAYEMVGLKIVENVDYSLNGLDKQKRNALGASSKSAPGYLVFKFVAPEGKKFQSLKVTAMGRLFSNNTPIEKEKITYSFGTSVSEYVTVLEDMATEYRGASSTFPNGNNPERTMLLNRQVRELTQFFFKIEISNSNDETWTNLKELSIEVGYEATQHADDFTVDFTQYAAGATDFSDVAYDAEGLRIKDGVSFYNVKPGGEVLNGLAPIEKGTAKKGYMVIKFQADGQQSFSALKVTSIARLFDNECQGTGEQLSLSFSKTGKDDDYEVFYDADITATYNNCPVVESEIDDKVYGLNTFFIRIDIGCSTSKSNDFTWTALRSIAFDVEYETVTLRVSYGGKTGSVLTVNRGSVLNDVITMPSGFKRTDDKIYTTKTFVENSSMAGTTLATEELEDKILYVKGEWGHYTVDYVLDGGTNAEGNATEYVDKDGMTLLAPTKEGYVFVGWFTDAAFTAPITQISQGHKGNLTLYAKFIPEESVKHEVTYVPEEDETSPLTVGLIVFACIAVVAVAGVVVFVLVQKGIIKVNLSFLKKEKRASNKKSLKQKEENVVKEQENEEGKDETV